jgi:hypothetical protein
MKRLINIRDEAVRLRDKISAIYGLAKSERMYFLRL